LELHHIVWAKDGGDNAPENLLALCPNCHSLHTQKYIPETAIRTWKGLLAALNSANRSTADLLLVLAADEERLDGREPTKGGEIPPRFRFTGDGLPALAGLISSGIVEISRRYSGAGFSGATGPSFEVSLTEKGRALVAGWRAEAPEPTARVDRQDKP
jgi:hypothetical protein